MFSLSYLCSPYYKRFLDLKKLLHLFLFLAAFFTCSMAGVAWVGNANPFELTNLYLGVEYACLILGFLTAHEFGHYFAAKYHGVACTLPYYIPFPLTPLTPISFGTMGAVIRIRGQIPSRKALFDIGVSGPLAGFVVCFGILIYGFVTLPDISYLMQFHPSFDPSAGPDSGALIFGDTALYSISRELFARPGAFVPPMHEIYHYPYLNVGWFGLFVTALNMLPLGQLDGGHILYSMIGKRQWKVGRVFWILLIVIGFSAVLDFGRELLKLYYEEGELGSVWSSVYLTLQNMHKEIPWLFRGWGGWLFWAVLARFFTGIKHPPIAGDGIGPVRMIVGIITFVIFILCFSWNGIYLT